jgi:hypothetical protein
MTEAKTEIVCASELQERVVERIAEIRNPEPFDSYRDELRRYKRRLGKRKEVVRITSGTLSETRERGFTVPVYDQDVFVPRPERPRPVAYGYSPYDRSMGFTSHAQAFGLLADARYNRDIRPERVAEYAEAMERGGWRDLLSDPIAVTADGHVLNGQHRIAAAVRVDWSEVGNDPAFLVIWNADPDESLHADGSRRTQKDEKTIAMKLVAAKEVS